MKLLVTLLLARLLVPALYLVAFSSFFAMTGCGGTSPWARRSEPGWESSHRILETKIDRLKGQIAGEKVLVERADFWRIVSIVLVGLVFFALVGGAALGSRARRENLHFRDADDSDQPLADTHDEVL